MSHNNLTGNLPSNWGVTGSFTQLTTLDLSYNANLAGGLPGLWGTWGAFPRLQALALTMTGLSGQLPQAWARRPRSRPCCCWTWPATSCRVRPADGAAHAWAPLARTVTPWQAAQTRCKVAWSLPSQATGCC